MISSIVLARPGHTPAPLTEEIPMIKHRIALFLALATLTAAASAGAAEPQKSVFNFRGLTGQALFSSINGCQITSVQIIGNQNVSHSVGEKPVTTDFATLIYISFNPCTGDFRILSGSAEASVSGSLQGGVTISGTIPVFDTAGIATTATLNVGLSPNGDVSHTVENFQITGGGTTVAVRSVGDSVPATSTGSVDAAGVDLLAGLGTGGGSIATTNGGTVSIFH
jgi:hypothetical protein